MNLEKLAEIIGAESTGSVIYHPGIQNEWTCKNWESAEKHYPHDIANAYEIKTWDWSDFPGENMGQEYNNTRINLCNDSEIKWGLVSNFDERDMTEWTKYAEKEQAGYYTDPVGNPVLLTWWDWDEDEE